MTSSPQVPYDREDRQWDIRINVQEDDYLQAIVENVMLENCNGKFKYVLIGGCEIGTRPSHTDYQVRHVHAAVIFNNRASKASIIKNWGIIEGNGYYMVPRNRDLPYSGWREHHIKPHSKVAPEESTGLIILEEGELPKDCNKRKAFALRGPEEKRMKTDDIIKEIRTMLENNNEEEAFQRFPSNYMRWGEKLKTMITQSKKKFFGKHNDPHLWLYGFPGSGKTSIMQLVYPGYYKKDLCNRFWDLYKDDVHTHTMLEDLDANAVEHLSIQWLKTICDEAGFPIDQKYKTPQLTRTVVLVTSNQDINGVLNAVDDLKDVENTKQAITRRFLQMRIDVLHRLLGIKLVNDYERKQLKKQGNEDPRQLYLDWNYNLDCPTGKPLLAANEYRKIIRDFYYDKC